MESILSFCHYTLNDDALTDYLDFFEQHEGGVINASPFSMGLLTDRGAPDWHPAPAQLKIVCKKAAQHCKAGEKASKNWLYSIPYQTHVLRQPYSVPTRSSSVLQNIAWASEPMDEELLNEVKEILEPRFRDTWLNS